jgi:hypothetical protein
MRALVDIVTTITGSIRFIFGLFFLCIFGLGLMVTAGATYIAPVAAEKVAEKAEKAHDKAIKAAREEARNRSYAADGWGYPAED